MQRVNQQSGGVVAARHEQHSQIVIQTRPMKVDIAICIAFNRKKCPNSPTDSGPNPNCPCPVDKSGHIGTGGIAGTKLLEKEFADSRRKHCTGSAAITLSIGR